MKNSDKTKEQLITEVERLRKRINELEKSNVKSLEIEENLRESEEKFKALYNNAPLSYQSLYEDGSFKDVNPAWLNTLGYTRDEIIGKMYSDFLHPDWKPHFEKNFPNFKKQGYVNDVQFKIRHKSGHYLDISFNGCIGYNLDGSVKQTYCVFQDITERKKADDELRFQANLLNAVEQSVIVTKPDGEIIYWNPFAEKAYGYASDEVLGKNIIDVTVPQLTQEQGMKIMQSLCEGKSWSGEFDVQHRNGSIFTSHVSDTPILNDKGEMIAIIGVSTDISERKLAENKLKESEQKYRLLLENTISGIAYYDIYGVLILINNKGAHNLGSEPKELIGKHLSEFLDKEMEELLWERLKTTISSGTANIYEDLLELPPGKMYFSSTYNPVVNTEGKTIGVQIISDDISERKKVELDLAESEEKFYKIFDKSPIAISLIDASSRIFIDINPAFKSLLGYSEKDVVGQNIDELNMIVDTQQDKELEKKIESTGKVDSTIVKYRKKNGNLGWAIVSGEIINVKGQQLILSMMHDISDQRKIETKIKESEANLLSLINNTRDHIWSLDRDYKYIIFNKTYANTFLHEYRVEVKKGMDSKKFLKPEELEFWVPMCESVFNGERKTFEYTHDFNGETRYFQTSLNPTYEDNEVIGLSALSVDITEIKLAEQEIAISNERYKTLFNDSPVPLWEEDFTDLMSYLSDLKRKNNGSLRAYFDNNPDELVKCAQLVKIIDVNKAAIALHKADNIELLLKDLNKTFTENSLVVFKEELIALAEGKKSFESEAELKTLSGELKHIYLKLKIDQSQSNIIKALLATSDITERKQNQIALQKSEEQFRFLTENSQDMIYRMLLPEGNYEYVSPSSTKIFGYTPKEFIDTPMLIKKIIHTDWINYFELEWDNILKDQMPPSYEYQIIHGKSGKVRWLNQRNSLIKNSDGKPIAIEGIVADITDRKTAEENIRLSEYKFRTIFEESTDGIMLLDVESNPIEVNNKICEILGYSKDELMTINANAHIHPEDTKEINYEDALEKLNSGEAIFATYRLFKKDKSIISVEVSVKMLENGMFLNIIRDITERIVLEKETLLAQEEIRKLNEKLELKVIERTAQLESANKELEAFSYSVSHDLKAPLRAIIGFSQILKEDYNKKLDDDGKHFINSIRENAENMGMLIKDLLDFSRMGRKQLQKTHLDMSALTEKVKIELLENNRDRTIDFKIQKMPNINADEKLMYHVMLNLLSNALKFSSKTKNARIEVGCNNATNENVFYVKDNGIGFDMKYVDKIFDVFQRLHSVEEFPGTGIGLSIVQRIIHKHEGKIWAESEKNKGTTFFFII